MPMRWGTEEPSGTLGGSALASWTPFWVILGIFTAIVVALVVIGRPNPTWGRLQVLSRAPAALERITGVPGWAATAVGTALVGLVLAGQGFYSDVAWHIALGRDEDVITAPHLAILVGLLLLLLGAVLGTVVATLDRIPGALRFGSLRVPPSLVPLWGLGAGAVVGFPLDEVWHREYGVDVTMWSPTHMLMILGATFTGLALWLIVGGSGVTVGQSRWGRGLHVLCAALTLQALAAPLGEFNFGVPQFRLVFAPILVCLAAGIALVASRIVHGPGWTLGIVAGMFLLDVGDGDGPVETRTVGLFVISAICVEVVALAVGTDRRMRFGLVAGTAVGTVGLAGEWLWNRGAHQPWSTALLPEAAILGLVAAVAGAVIGVALARAIRGEPRPHAATLRPAALALAAAVLVVVLPLPRATGEVTADIRLEPAGDGFAFVAATLSPPDAAEGAEWFQASAWQGGGLELAAMEPTSGAGAYRSARAVPVDGHWKTLLRLHRGDEMMAIPLYLPADPGIDAAEIPAVDRTAAFESERRYLLRETRPGNGWLSPVVHGFLVLVCLGWALAFRVAAVPPVRRPRCSMVTPPAPDEMTPASASPRQGR